MSSINKRTIVFRVKTSKYEPSTREKCCIIEVSYSRLKFMLICITIDSQFNFKTIKTENCTIRYFIQDKIKQSSNGKGFYLY